MQFEETRILIVDDIPENIDILRHHLARKECVVASAVNGAEALKALFAFDPDVILLDIMMPEMDGFQCIDRIRNDPEAPQPSIIAVSARSDAEAIIRALDAGANDYVIKPYDFKVVWARIERQLIARRSMALAREMNTRLVGRLQKFRSVSPGETKLRESA